MLKRLSILLALLGIIAVTLLVLRLKKPLPTPIPLVEPSRAPYADSIGARALVHEPRLIICDEPTASLDAKTGHHALELLKQSACRPDRCVIVVTHDSRIFSFADSIAEMEDGKVIMSCPAAEYQHA
jgi:ABC-type arginine transport system ATPase subunit